MNNRAIKFLSIFLAVILMVACTKDKGPFNTSEEVLLSPEDTVSYAVHVQPIFDANCTNCHNATHAKLDLLPAVSYNQLLFTGFSAPYVDTANAAQSKLYKHLTGALSIMPPQGAIAESQQELILEWIEQGALDN